MRLLLFRLFILPFFFLVAVTPVGAAVVQSTPSPPQFTLQAGAGRLAPGGPFSFLGNVYDSFKLLFAFSDNAKAIKRMDIADSKIVQMKNAAEANNPDNVKKAGENYVKQITAVQKALADKKLDTQTLQTLKLRVHDQDEAFTYLFSIPNDKINPLLHDYWSQLQNLKTYL